MSNTAKPATDVTKQTALDGDRADACTNLSSNASSCTFGGSKAKADLSGTGCCGETSVCQDALRERAYLKWEAAGYPQGDGIDFWLEAEAELKAEAEEAA